MIHDLVVRMYAQPRNEADALRRWMEKNPDEQAKLQVATRAALEKMGIAPKPKPKPPPPQRGKIRQIKRRGKG